MRLSLGPVRLRQANRVPSGDHWKLLAPFLRLVTRRASPPFIDRSQICGLDSVAGGPSAPGRDDMNARLWPSGLQRGEFEFCGLVVNRQGARLPSIEAIQIDELRRFCFWSTVVTT